MDIKFKFGKIDVAAGIWLKLAGYIMAIAAGLCLLYYFAVANSINKYSKLSRQVEALSAKSAQYRSFSDVGQNMEQIKERTDALLSGYENALAGAQRSQNTFLDQISDISIQSNVRLEKIAPVEMGDKKYWEMAFSADYASICELFLGLEKYFRVESFQIHSGQGGSNLSKVSLMVSSLSSVVPMGGVDKNVAAKDIFELYDEVSYLLKKIDARSDENALIQLAKSRDPMSFSDTIFPAEKKKVERTVERKVEKKEVFVERPPVEIEGIYWDPTIPVVVIRGNAMKAGDEVDGVKIQKILEDKVVVLWKGKQYDLRK